MVAYVCALVGFEAHVVVAQADSQEFVCAILDKVLVKASNALVGFQTIELHLYLAKIDDDWIHSDGDAAVEMRSGAIPRSVRDLVGSSKEIDQAGTIQSRIGDVPQTGGVTHLLIVPTKGRIEQDQDYDDGVNRIAARLKDHPYVVQLDRTIESVRRHTGKHPTPFIVLENSSGTGKTQMAFNLEAHGVHEVYYIPYADAIDGALDPPDGGHSLSHTMYQAYRSRAECFLSCVQNDIALLADGSVQNTISTDVLHTYGFIVAALRGKGNVGNFAVTRADVVEALEQRGKPCVFFLDEFPRVGSPIVSALTDKKREESVTRVRIMRNTFRSFGIPVVISSTNGSARNLLQLGSRSRDAVQTDGVLWCFIFPRLPPASVEDEIDALYLPEILQQI